MKMSQAPPVSELRDFAGEFYATLAHMDRAARSAGRAERRQGHLRPGRRFLGGPQRCPHGRGMGDEGADVLNEHELLGAEALDQDGRC